MVTSLHRHSTEIVKDMFHHKLTDFFFFFWESKISDPYGRTALAGNECSHKRILVNINTVASGEGAKKLYSHLNLLFRLLPVICKMQISSSFDSDNPPNYTGAVWAAATSLIQEW